MANPAAPAATPAAAAVHAAAAPAAAAPAAAGPAVVPALPAAAPAVAPARRVNRRNYTLAETLSLIEAVEEILPLCGPEWEQVEHRHASRYPELTRTSEQLKRKFNELARRVSPTGDPTIPQDVREAKRVRALMIEKTEGGTGSVSDGYGLQLGFGDEGDVDEEVASINQGEDNALGALFGEDAAAVGGANGGMGEAGAAGAGGGVGVRPLGGRTRSRSTSSTPTPLTNRRQRSRNNDEGPSFNQVFMMMMAEQRRERQQEQERQRRAEAQQQLNNTMMQTMLMTMMAHSGMPMGPMQGAVAAAAANATGNMNAPGQPQGTARERREARQLEREDARAAAWLQREESIQQAMAADPSITRAELENMRDEEDEYN